MRKFIPLPDFVFPHPPAGRQRRSGKIPAWSQRRTALAFISLLSHSHATLGQKVQAGVCNFNLINFETLLCNLESARDKIVISLYNFCMTVVAWAKIELFASCCGTVFLVCDENSVGSSGML